MAVKPDVVMTLDYMLVSSGDYNRFITNKLDGSMAIGSFVGMPKRRRFALANFGLVAVLAGSIWHQAFVSINHIAEINLPDTRWVSIEYIERSLPPGSRIGREHYTPPIEQYSDKFITEYLGHQAVAVKPDVVMTLDYMLVSSGDYNRFITEPNKYPDGSMAYRKFFEQHELVKEFIPDGNKLTGPRIGIYKIRHE